MMKKYLGAIAITFVASAAIAQPAAEQPEPTVREGGEMPPHGFAPPSDETPPTEGKPSPAENNTEPHAGVDTHTGAGKDHEGAHGDNHGAAHGFHAPTNWYHLHYGKDALGGLFGDGKMVDPHTNQVVEAKEEPMSAPFLFAVFNFAILMALLLWKGRPAVTQAAADRHDQIKTALEEAAQLRKQAADKLAEYETKLKKSDEEIQALVDGIRASADADKARILEHAQRQSDQMKKDAESRIAAEIDLARARLTREVTEAATLATEKILREKLIPADQQKLVGAFITDLGNAKPVTKEQR